MTRTASTAGYELGLLAAAGALTIIPWCHSHLFCQELHRKGIILGTGRGPCLNSHGWLGPGRRFFCSSSFCYALFQWVSGRDSVQAVAHDAVCSDWTPPAAIGCSSASWKHLYLPGLALGVFHSTLGCVGTIYSVDDFRVSARLTCSIRIPLKQVGRDDQSTE